MESINEKIKRLRIEKGLNQDETAIKVGISRNSYFLIEKGTTKTISLELGKKIAKALEISFNELFEIENLSYEKAKIELEKLREMYDKQLTIEKDLRDLLDFFREDSKDMLNRIALFDKFFYIDNELFKKHYHSIIEDIVTYEVYPLEVVNKFWSLHQEKAKVEILKFIDLNKLKTGSFAKKSDLNITKLVTYGKDGEIAEKLYSYKEQFQKYLDQVIEAKKNLKDS